MLWSKDLLPGGAVHPTEAGGGALGLGSLDECLLLFVEEDEEVASFSNLKLYLNDVINGFKPIRLSSLSNLTCLRR